MPHRLLVGTFHPCGTVTQCTGRDAYDWRKSLIWPRGIATSSASVSSSSTLPAVKPYQSAASPLHKIPDISKHDPAGSGADSSCIPALLGAGKLRRARSSDIDVSALLRRLPPVENAQNGKGQQLNRLEAVPPAATLGDPDPGPARPSGTGSSLRPAPAPAAALVRPRPQPAPVPGRHHQHHKVCANAEAAAAREPEPPRSIDSGGRMKRRSSSRQAAHGSSSNLKKEDNATSHRSSKLNNSKKAAAAVNKSKIAVRVSMSMTRADSRSHAMAMDDVVLLMVPRDALGSRVIALALAAREFDWEDDHHVANGPENPDHFDLLRLRPATTYTAAGLGSQQDRFQIGAGVEKTKPIGDAGTLYFVLCRSRE